MTATPIQAYRFVPIGLINIYKSGKKTKSGQLTESDVDHDMIDGGVTDSDSSFSVWSQDITSDSNTETISQEQLIKMIDEAAALSQIYEHLPIEYRKRIKKIAQPFKHLTLPEALIYFTLMQKDPPKTSLTAKLVIIQSPSHTRPLKLKLTLKIPKKTLKKWILTYEPKTLKVSISCHDQKVGQLRYILRNQKLEEIDGTYNRRKLILDPVWLPKKRLTLKQEHLTYGTRKIDLIYSKNEKHALLRLLSGKSSNLNVNNLKNYQKDPHTIITKKSVTLGQLNIRTNLIFSKGILIPVGVQMVLNPVS